LARELLWDEPPSATPPAESLQHSLTDRERIQLYERQISRMNKLQSHLSERNMLPNGIAEQSSLHDQSESFKHDRHTIFGCGIEFDGEGDSASQFTVPVYEKTEAQIAFLKEALSNNFIFMEMTETELSQFIGAMQPEKVPSKGTKVIQQGDVVGDFFYIVESGTIDFVQEKGDQSTLVGSCQAGGSFGELALLYCSPRAVTCVTTSENVVLWKIDQTTFRHLLAHQDRSHQSNMKDLLRSISVFQGLDDSLISRFAKSLTPVHWKEGQRIVQKGDEGSVFYIIQSGNVKVHDIGLGDSIFDDLVLGPGDYFGERALVTGEPRAANVTALNEVITMAVDRETFEASLGPLQNLLEREMRKQSLKVIPIFAHSQITDPELQMLADRMQEVCYRKGEHLAVTGAPYEMNLWVIRHGRLVVYSKKHDKLYNLMAGDYFGDKSLMGDPDHVSSHTAICEENLTTWILTRDQIEDVVGDIHRLGRSVDYLKQKSEQAIQLKDLKRVKVLGKGAFGKVWLVTYMTSDSPKPIVYALKAISKANVIDSKLEKAVVREKELLQLLNHPFILNLVASYQDADYLYLLLPLILGGELYSLLGKIAKQGHGMENDMVAFYAACILEALKHFHIGRRIAYRDLKLENILIDEQGYAKIIDLGFAKIVTEKTYTLCGTPEMLAPEIIMSKGHDQAVDYWAFGVIVYELLVGHTPFYQRGSSQMDMFKRIVLVVYETPDFVSDSARTMIEKLLVRKQSLRLGNLANGCLDIKDQPWFRESGINFRNILSKSVQAPWKPPIHDPLDASNFDDMSVYEHERSSRQRQLTREEQELFKGF
jgi:CRP-like cAMP-binding protein